MDKNSTIRDIKLSKTEELEYIKPFVKKLNKGVRNALLHFSKDSDIGNFYVSVGVLVNNLGFAGSVKDANDIVEAIEDLCIYLGEDNHLTWSILIKVKGLIDLAVDEFDC